MPVIPSEREGSKRDFSLVEMTSLPALASLHLGGKTSKSDLCLNSIVAPVGAPARGAFLCHPRRLGYKFYLLEGEVWPWQMRKSSRSVLNCCSVKSSIPTRRGWRSGSPPWG